MAEAQGSGGRGFGGFTSFGDMFDGGGAGRSGDQFEGGGFISGIGNAMGGPGMFGGGGNGGGFNMGRMAGSLAGSAIAGPFGGLLGGMLGQNMGQGFGYTNAAGMPVSARQDMMDGGGRGMAGDTFQGGLLSAIINAMGARPMGYNARQDAMGMDAPAPAPTPDVTRRALSPAMSMNPMMRPTRPAAPPVNYAPPMQPGMNSMPGGNPFLRQNIAVVPAMRGPSVNMGQSDMGTLRPFVSRVPTMLPR